MKRRWTGFTLLELMIAILLFAMISSGSLKLFTSVSTAQQSTQQTLKALSEIRTARLMLQQDLSQVAGRSIRDEFGDFQPAFQTRELGGYLFEFTRLGWKNPLKERRSRLQRVAYALEQNQLVRYFWPVLDRSQDSQPFRQVLLSGVSDLRLRFMNTDQQWQSSWPEKLDEENEQTLRWQTLPLAVELIIVSDLYDSMTLILPMGGLRVEEAT